MGIFEALIGAGNLFLINALYLVLKRTGFFRLQEPQCNLALSWGRQLLENQAVAEEWRKIFFSSPGSML